MKDNLKKIIIVSISLAFVLLIAIFSKDITGFAVGDKDYQPVQLQAPINLNDDDLGSILIYNIYTSSPDVNVDPSKNTRISITNTNQLDSVSVHFYFVADSGGVADTFICLTPGQTYTFYTSDLDPGTTGFIVAVATDYASGVPINFNYLLGQEEVKFSSGHQAGLLAMPIKAIAAEPALNEYGTSTCIPDPNNAVPCKLVFDGQYYDRLPLVNAFPLYSPNDGNQMMLILNAIGGDYTYPSGSDTLGMINGLLYDDAENPYPFSFNESLIAQKIDVVSNSFPNTSPDPTNIIPAEIMGWMKTYKNPPVTIGLTGAYINYNNNCATNDPSKPVAFCGGENMIPLTNNDNPVEVKVPVSKTYCG